MGSVIGHEAGAQTVEQGARADESRQGSAVEEIMVTARRDVERLQDVPASLSVLTADQIERSGVVNMEQIVGLTAGVSMNTGNADVGDTQINIRGMNGARDAENNVALVIDGILKTNASQLNQPQTDLAQVEILKGPQGAYYGRNAAAGAIVMTTVMPGDELSGRARVGGGDNNLYYGRALLSGPLSDNLGFVVKGDYRKTDGFYLNTGPIPDNQGATVDRLKQWNLGTRLVYNVSSNLDLDLKARVGKAFGGALIYNVGFSLPGFASALGDPLFNEDNNDHRFVFEPNVHSENEQRTVETSVKATQDLEWATLTAWVDYSDVKQDFAADASLAGTGRFNNTPECQSSVADLFASGYQPPAPQFLAPTPQASLLGPFGPTTCDGYQYTVRNETDVSGEIRLASTMGAWSWSVGVYYLNIDRHFGVSVNTDRGLGTTRHVYNPPGSIAPTTILFDDRYRTDVYAGFGSLKWDVTDELSLSTALRYDREEREVESLVPNVADPITGGVINPGLAYGPLVPKDRVFDQWEPKASIIYKPTDLISFYVNWGIGFRAGGFNPQGTTALIQDYINIPLQTDVGVTDDYEKEVSYASEVGFKAQLWDRRLTLEGAYYHTDVDDMQYWEIFTGSFGIARTVSNIDRVRIDGGELAATLVLLDGWKVFAAGNITDSEIRANSVRRDTVGNKSPYTPDFTINAGTDVNFPVTQQVNAFARADVRITGATWFSPVQDQDIRTIYDLVFPGLGVANYSNTKRDTYTVVDLHLGVESEGWSLTFYATNLLDKKIIQESVVAPEFGGEFIAPGARRTIGAEVGWKF